MTRNPSSSKAQKLKSLGAEVVQADLNDPPSLVRVFHQANAIFANTDFWATYHDPKTAKKSQDTGKSIGELAFEAEVQHGKNIADAAAGVDTLERFIFSTLPRANKASEGEIANCYHWDSKGAIVDYIDTTYPDLAAKMSLLCLACYADNPFIIPRWDDNDKKYKLIIPLDPEARLPTIDAASSTGVFVKALIEEAPGTQLLAYDSDSNLTMPEIQNIWCRATGKDIEFPKVTVEEVERDYGIPEEILAAPQLISKYGYMGGMGGYIEPRDLKQKISTRTYADWVAENWQNLLDC